MTKYGLEIESEYSASQTQPVILKILEGENKTIKRSAPGLLVISMLKNSILRIEEDITDEGLYHTYIYVLGENTNVYIESKINSIENKKYDISHHVDFSASNSNTKIKTNGVVRKFSEIIYIPTIKVDPVHRSIKASQVARFLNISNETGKISSIPKLIISTDDIICDHSLSLESIKIDDLEYLISKGHSLKSAEEAIIDTFLHD